MAENAIHRSRHRSIEVLRRRPEPALAALVLLPAAALLCAATAAAADACGSPAGAPVWAERAARGDEIVLVDGRRLRLAGVEAPRVPLTARGETAARAAAETRAAREALAERVEGREIAVTEIGTDRHGRRLGHLYDTETGQWIEEDLVAAGRLRVLPGRSSAPCDARLLAAEARARAARLGLWGNPVFAVIPARAEDLAARVGERVVTEGRVRSVGRSTGRIWLNFGDDFRRDFAVVMDDKDLGRFRAAGFDALAATGWTVRVRGVVVFHDGPRIAVGTPASIERVTR